MRSHGEAADPLRGQAIYAEHLDQMVLCEELGFDAVCINEHHAKPYGLMPSPNIVAAALTRRTRRIPIGILDNLRDPRQRARAPRPSRAAGRGDRHARRHVRRAHHFGLRPRCPPGIPGPERALPEARERLQEAWDLIVTAWTAREPFEWRGTYFSYDRVSIWPRPLQQPHPPIVFPADSDEGLELAARRRAGTGAAYRSNARTRSIFERYRASRPAMAGRRRPNTVTSCATSTWPRPTRRREEAEPHLDYFWQKLLSYHRGSMKLFGQTPPAPPPVVRSAEELPLYAFDFDLTQKEGMTIVRDPDYVLREIRAQLREVGAGTLMGLFQFGSLPHALACKNIEMFATRALPELRRG